MQPAEEAKQFYDQALAYDEAGDVYNAIKLYKRAIKLQVEWPVPYFRLLSIYKRRQEWKPSYHYAKRYLALDPADPIMWWDLGIAATALKKWRIAKNVWSKFDIPSSFPKGHKAVFSLALSYGKQMELVWARPLCPARAEIISIPRSDSRRYYKDVVLYDRQQLRGHNISGHHKLPIYEYLGHWKHSNYRTYSCWIYTGEEKDIETLASLCFNAGLGFENWSNSALNTIPKKRKKKPEFYNLKTSQETPEAAQWVAMAAYNRRDVERLLRQWQLISLKEYGPLEQHS